MQPLLQHLQLGALGLDDGNQPILWLAAITCRTFSCLQALERLLYRVGCGVADSHYPLQNGCLQAQVSLMSRDNAVYQEAAITCGNPTSTCLMCDDRHLKGDLWDTFR